MLARRGHRKGRVARAGMDSHPEAGRRVSVRLNDSRSIEGSVSPWSTDDVLLLDDARMQDAAGESSSRDPRDSFIPLWQVERISGRLGTPAHGGIATTPVRLALLTLAIFALSVVVGIAARYGVAGQEEAFTGSQSNPARVELMELNNAPSVQLSAGRQDLSILDRALTEVGRPDILQRQGERTWLLSQTVVVRPGALLDLSHVELRMMSGREFVGLEARGGFIEVDESLVTSWDPAAERPDEDVSDGRAWVLARDGGRLNITSSGMQMLGYDAPERYGVSWRTSGTDGKIEDSIIVGNFYGLYMNRVEPMVVRDSTIEASIKYGLDPHSDSRGFVIEGNVFRNNGKHGMILAEGCSDAVVRNNEAYGNRQHGIVVFEASNDARITNNEIYDNGRSGIDVANSDRVFITSNDIYGNGTGITVHDEAKQTLVERNRLTANRGDGIRLSTGASQTRIIANMIDFNYRNGVYLDEAVESLATRNEVIDNVTGISIEDSDHASKVVANTIAHNVTDGVHLQVNPSAVIEENLIRTNGEAAFSVSKVATARPYLSTNTVGAHPQGSERVRDD
jgi:parallel beta-helix repeat protein